MSYDVRSLTLPPGQTISLPFLGTTVAVLAADQSFLIGANDDEPQFITAGLKLSPNGGFNKVRLLNPAGADISVQIGLINGDITDSRLQASGNINVRDPGAGGESFADVIAAINASTNADVVAMLQNANDKRASVHEIGASFLFSTSIASGAGGTAIVSPGSNTSGVILRTLNTDGNGNVVTLFVDAAGPSAWNDTSKRAVDFIRNEAAIALPLEIPAGQGLYASASGAGSRLVATWDNL